MTEEKNKAFEIFMLDVNCNTYLRTICGEATGGVFKDYRLKLIVSIGLTLQFKINKVIYCKIFARYM